MSKQQTAVEWLQFKINDFLFVTLAEERKLKDLFDQAKAMEKQQIIDDFKSGYDAGWCMANEYIGDDAPTVYDAEQYYNQTYAK